MKNCFVHIQTRRGPHGPSFGLLNQITFWFFFFFLECQNYQVLSNADRKVTNHASPLLCDKALGPAWFRFQGDAGTKMPTSCIPPNRCGTHAAGWLNGAHPREHEGKQTRQACFSWRSGCCQWSVNIQVQNCSGYYLYYINGTYPGHLCNLRPFLRHRLRRNRTLIVTFWKGTSS